MIARVRVPFQDYDVITIITRTHERGDYLQQQWCAMRFVFVHVDYVQRNTYRYIGTYLYNIYSYNSGRVV